MKKETTKRKKLKKLSDIIKRKWLILTLAIILFPFLVLFFLKGASYALPGTLFVITGNVESWFSNIISYSGVVVSIILGIYTLYLTLVLDEINTENHNHDNRISIITNMPNMICSNMCFYSLCGDKIKNGYFSKFWDKEDCVMTFQMKPAFPPYFKVEMKEIKMKVINMKNDEAIIRHAKLSSKDYIIKNNKEFKTFINIPEQMEDVARYVYGLNNVTTSATTKEHYTIEIWIEFKCCNVLIDKDEQEPEKYYDDIPFIMHLSVVNTGKDQDNYGGIIFDVLNLQFERKESGNHNE